MFPKINTRKKLSKQCTENGLAKIIEIRVRIILSDPPKYEIRKTHEEKNPP